MKSIKQEQNLIVGYEVKPTNWKYQKPEEKDLSQLYDVILNLETKIVNLISLLWVDYKKGLLKGHKSSDKNNWVQIHKEIVRKYLDKDFYKSRMGFVKLDTELNKALRDLIDENLEKISEIKNFFDVKENEQKNKTFLADNLKFVFTRKGLEFFISLLSGGIEFKNLENSNKLEELRDSFQMIKTELKSFEYLLSNSESGLNIFNGSLNYYSVNKKDNQDNNEKEKLENLEREKYDFKTWIEKIQKDNKPNKRKELLEILNLKIDRNNLKNKEVSDKKVEEISLKELRNFLKKVKSEEKSRFYRDIQNPNLIDTFTNEKIKEEYPFFEFKNKKSFDEFKKYTKNIINLNQKKQKYKKGSKEWNELRQKIKVNREKRGKVLQMGGAKYYKELNELYKKVAAKLGKLDNQIELLKQSVEKIAKMNHWLLFGKVDNLFKIFAISREFGIENLSQARKFLESKKENKNGEIEVLWFNSFTLKALEKLLRKDSFRFDVNVDWNKYLESKDSKKQENVNDIWDKYLQSKDQKKQGQKEEINERELVEFYQKVLQTSYVKNNLDLKFDGIEKVLNQKYSKIEDFRKDLERISYRIDKIYLSKSEYNEFLKKFQVKEFEIENHHRSIKHKKYWNYFWSKENFKNNFSIRLNPEISFYFKNKEDDFELGDKLKHRFARNRIIIKINYNLNIPSEKIKFNFTEKQKIWKEIEKFNEEFQEKNKDLDLYYFGIDRGTDELSSLGIYKDFSKNNLDGYDYETIKIKVYSLKDEYYNEENLKNLSKKNWINDNLEKFEKKEVDYLDLSIAKLIDGKIIENADLKTYFETQKLHTKKKIFELGSSLINNSFDRDSIDSSDFEVFVKQKTDNPKYANQKVGFYKKSFEIFEKWRWKEYREELNEWIKLVKENRVSGSEFELERIKNYKKALASNQIGILNFLRKKYENVLFVLEDLNSELVDIQSNKQAGFAVHRFFEWGLLNKMRKVGLVPEKIDQQIIFRELDKLNLKGKGGKQGKKESGENFQIGNIVFVPEAGTSSVCPNCSNKEDFKKDKFKINEEGKRELTCIMCKNKYHPDEVACINIANLGSIFWNNEN